MTNKQNTPIGIFLHREIHAPFQNTCFCVLPLAMLFLKSRGFASLKQTNKQTRKKPPPPGPGPLGPVPPGWALPAQRPGPARPGAAAPTAARRWRPRAPAAAVRVGAPYLRGRGCSGTSHLRGSPKRRPGRPRLPAGVCGPVQRGGKEGSALRGLCEGCGKEGCALLLLHPLENLLK